VFKKHFLAQISADLHRLFYYYYLYTSHYVHI